MEPLTEPIHADTKKAVIIVAHHPLPHLPDVIVELPLPPGHLTHGAWTHVVRVGTTRLSGRLFEALPVLSNPSSPLSHSLDHQRDHRGRRREALEASCSGAHETIVHRPGSRHEQSPSASPATSRYRRSSFDRSRHLLPIFPLPDLHPSSLAAQPTCPPAIANWLILPAQ